MDPVTNPTPSEVVMEKDGVKTEVHADSVPVMQEAGWKKVLHWVEGKLVKVEKEIVAEAEKLTGKNKGK